jgi:hypothetical protein
MGGMHCETCHAPIMGVSDLELDLSHIAYWLVMKWPLGWFERVWFALLPWAGTIAYACSCRNKNRAAIAKATAEQESGQ